MANFNWITGPEQAHIDSNWRTVLDYVFTYTGIKKLTLGLNVDYGWETDEAYLKASGTRGDIDASWWGGPPTSRTTGRRRFAPRCGWSI